MSEHYKEILEKLRNKYQIEKCYGQTVYKLIRNGYIYLRFSSEYKRQGKYFFGIEKEVLDKFGEQPYCILFTCGKIDNVVVMPDYLFKSIIRDLRLSGGQYKINIFFTDEKIDLKVTGKDRIDVTRYLNGLDYIFTRPVHEKVELSVREKEKPEEIKKEKEAEEELREIIKNELIVNSKNSKEPKVFESSIIKFLKHFGFTVEHISGAGDTDIFVKEPFKTIIDAKSTSKRSLTRINFSRLKQHKQKHNADYVAVVSNGFDPAVDRDAKIENTTLLSVKVLCEILEVDRNYPLIADDLHYLFRIHGEVISSNLDNLRKYSEESKKYLDNIHFIVNVIDKVPRNISEIYGRYELKCEQLLTEKLDKETMEQTIKFLSLPVLNILETDGKNNYYRKLSIHNSSRRLSYIADLIIKNKLKML